MTEAEQLMQMIYRAANGELKTGFTVGGVTYTINAAAGTVTFTGTVPVDFTFDATEGDLKVQTKDFITLAAA